jgi:hypothetical protein
MAEGLTEIGMYGVQIAQKIKCAHEFENVSVSLSFCALVFNSPPFPLC